MAYLRYGTKLPSGNRSESFIIGDPSGLINLGERYRIPYSELREWFKTKNDICIKKDICEKLKLEGEELDVVCDMLFLERNNKGWDKPFDFEK